MHRFVVPIAFERFMSKACTILLTILLAKSGRVLAITNSQNIFFKTSSENTCTKQNYEVVNYRNRITYAYFVLLEMLARFSRLPFILKANGTFRFVVTITRSLIARENASKWNSGKSKMITVSASDPTISELE